MSVSDPRRTSTFNSLLHSHPKFRENCVTREMPPAAAFIPCLPNSGRNSRRCMVHCVKYGFYEARQRRSLYIYIKVKCPFFFSRSRYFSFFASAGTAFRIHVCWNFSFGGTVRNRRRWRNKNPNLNNIHSEGVFTCRSAPGSYGPVPKIELQLDDGVFQMTFVSRRGQDVAILPTCLHGNHSVGLLQVEQFIACFFLSSSNILREKIIGIVQAGDVQDAVTSIIICKRPACIE